MGGRKRERKRLGYCAEQPAESRCGGHFHRLHGQPYRICRRYQRRISENRYSELHHSPAEKFKQVCFVQGYQGTYGRSEGSICRAGCPKSMWQQRMVPLLPQFFLFFTHNFGINYVKNSSSLKNSMSF